MAKEDRAKKVISLLEGPLELDSKSANDILRIVTWAEVTGVRVACSAFLKLYNKGNVPKDEVLEFLNQHEGFIQGSTFFGKLLTDVYNVVYEHRHHAELAKEQQEEKMRIFLAELDSEQGVNP